MKLLIKFPTRSRPETFLSTLNTYYKLLSGLVEVTFVVSFDDDDPTMNEQSVLTRLGRFPSLHAYAGSNKSKVEAMNADVHRHADFDILLLALKQA